VSTLFSPLTRSLRKLVPGGGRGVPPEGAPSGSRSREVEGYRGLAAMCTVVFHVWQHNYTYDSQGSHPPIENRFLGALPALEWIDFFLVLSAYLLTLSYARAAIDERPVKPAKAFLFRRAVRILPLYLVAVLFVWATRNPAFPGDWTDLLRHLTFTQVFDREQIFYTIGPTWSLSLEIQFYILLVLLGPLAVRACRRIERRRHRVALLAGGCALLYLIPVAWISVAHYVLGIPHTDWPMYFGPQARFGAFAAGMGLAVLMTALGDRGRLSARAALTLQVGVAAALYLLSYASDDPEDFASTFSHPIASLLWLVLLFATVHTARRPRWQRVLTARWLTGVGLVSYSLYMWHEPIMLALYDAGLVPARGPGGFPFATVIVLLVALPAAWASYWLIEYPGSLLGRLRDAKGRPREFYPAPARQPSS
jgi:peptidoglycan/LPS O-acetylase OafA/YrhL